MKARDAVLPLVLALMMAWPPDSARACRPTTRSCFANQKTIAGAVEMYNLDFDANVRELTPALWEELKENGYLRGTPNDPGFGPGSHDNYVLTPGGDGIACLNHGSIRGGGDPRQDLIDNGVTDPALIARARRCRVVGDWRMNPGPGDAAFTPHATAMLVLTTLFPFQTQVPVVLAMPRR